MTPKKTSKTATAKKPAATRPILSGGDALAVLKSDSPKKALAALATPTDPQPPKSPRVAKDVPAEDGLVVFAFRLSREERDLIHAATGPSKASRFVRTLAIAGARGDEEAVREILDSIKLKPAA